MESSNNVSEKIVWFDLRTGSGDNNDDKDVMNALGQAQWLEACWFPSQRRKHPSVEFSIQDGCKVRIVGASDEDWCKQVHTVLKKIVVEDLGNMDAIELKDTIPEEDNEGRGMQDLMAHEKQQSVKVVFLEHNKHVLLVGQKAKLQKKTFVIRNMLSHYHWRLTGKDISR